MPVSYFRTIRNSARKTQLRASGNVSGSRSFSCTGLSAFSNAAVFSESTSVTPTEISNQPRRPGSRMSARFNVTRSPPDSQTYPPFAVQVDSETSKDRDQCYWSRSFAFSIKSQISDFGFRVSTACLSERREPQIDRLRLQRFVDRRCLK